jgi:hypothetical protein
MVFPDLDDARRHHAALLEIIIHHPGGWADRASRHRVAELCGEAASAIDDAQCAQQIEAIASYAADLFSEQVHRRWDRGNTSGADFLRLEIVRTLHSYRRRLSAIEARRLASGSSQALSLAQQCRHLLPPMRIPTLE